MIHNKIDKIFLILFMSSLLIPLIHLSDAQISSKENRKLTQYQSLYFGGQLNLDWGKDFEAFLKDRFYGRMTLIQWHKVIQYFISSRYVKFGSIIADKKTKWIYEHLQAGGIKESAQKKIIRELQAFNEYCQKNNILLYVEPIPRKEMIYPPELIKKNLNEEAQKSMNEIKEKSGVHFVFPLKELLEEKEKSPYLLYHKTDHHATHDGAYIGYKSLMREIQKDFSDVPVVSLEDFEYSYNKKVATEYNTKFTYGTTCNLAGLSPNICTKFLDMDFRYWKHKKSSLLKKIHTQTENLIKTEFFYPDGIDLKVMVFGDSYTPNLMKFLPYSFNHVWQIRINGPQKIRRNDQLKILKYYRNDIEKIKPDIIVIYVFYSLVGKFRTLTVLD